ncbi:Hypothetical protein PBC10988_13330 [Planctomycetales bacterium 10988]|nr:Hypothetical protein PBC10988_13330 [Planctomycetales bacterium 10988]
MAGLLSRWICCLAGLMFPVTVLAQFGPPPRESLSSAIQISKPDSTTRFRIELAQAYLKNEKWTEALDLLQQLSEVRSNVLISSTSAESSFQHSVSLQRYVQQLLNGLPENALKLYRQRVDSQTRLWLEEGIRNRDEALLRQMVQDAFASEWTEDALLTLGEFAFQRGDFDQARTWWRKLLSPNEPGSFAERGTSYLAYRKRKRPAADLYAQLVLTYIVEGDSPTARRLLEESLFGDSQGFLKKFPEASGTMGGRTGSYASLLQELLEESDGWKGLPPGDWPTFAGNFQRNGQAFPMTGLAGVAWSYPLSPVQGNRPVIESVADQAIGEAKNRRACNYFPVVAGDLVFVYQRRPNESRNRYLNEILAFDLETGQPAWGRDDPVIYRDSDQTMYSVPSFGVPRFTLTVHDQKLFARLRSPVTRLENGLEPTLLICLDLQREGELLWEMTSGGDGWAFEGTPIGDGKRIYVAMRQSGGSPKLHLACLDAETGKILWRQFICSAETWPNADQAEITHTLVTLQGEDLFINTGLGAVASLNKKEGTFNWLVQYPRTLEINQQTPQSWYYRDLVPCVYYHGLLLVACAETPLVMALDAETGQIYWKRSLPEVRQLLGADADRLVASGNRLFWIDLSITNPEQGGSIIAWAGDGSVHEYGRGLLAGGQVVWPNPEGISLYDLKSAQPTGQLLTAADPLLDRVPFYGGNLLLADSHWILAEPDRLVCYSQSSQPQSKSRERFLFQPPEPGRASLGRLESFFKQTR